MTTHRPAATDEGLREALRDANHIIAMMRDHLSKDHPECAYTALGIMNDSSRAALANPVAPLDVLAAKIAEDWNGRALDTAWAVVERALPEGWWLVGVTRDGDADAFRWQADANGPTKDDHEYGDGREPDAALFALADRLRAAHPDTAGEPVCQFAGCGLPRRLHGAPPDQPPNPTRSTHVFLDTAGEPGEWTTDASFMAKYGHEPYCPADFMIPEGPCACAAGKVT